MSKKRVAGKRKNSKILDEIVQNSYLGKIVDIDDPNKEGRCKILVYGVYGDESKKLEQIPTADLPWSYPMRFGFFGKNGAGTFSTPKMGAVVRVWFDGDQYHPFYYAIEDLSKELKDALKDAYQNFHSIIFDEEKKLRIYYSTKSGLLLNLDDSIINILPDGAIVLSHKNSLSSLELRGDTITGRSNNAIDLSSNNRSTMNTNFAHINGATTHLGANPIYANVNGEILFLLLAALATGVDAKLPITSGTFAALVEQFKPLVLSQTVKTTP